MLLLMAYGATQAQPEIQWENNFGGSNSDVANDIEQTADGGYVVAGYSYSSDGDISSNNGEEDYWIVKLDATGELEWENNFGGSGVDKAQDIEQTEDGGYVIAGGSESSDGDVGGNQGDEDYWILKLDEKGQLEWENNLGGSGEDQAQDIEQTEDWGYVVAGWSSSSGGDVGENNGEGDYWIVKLNANGQLDWENSFGGSKFDIASPIQQTKDEGYLVTGYSESSDGDVSGNNGSADYWILKLDRSGQLEWENNFGGSGLDLAKSIEQTEDRGYVVAGWTHSNDGDVGSNNGYEDSWIVKLDKSGQLLWEKNLGGSNTDRAESIEQTADGGFVVAGYSASKDGNVSGNYGSADYWILKLDKSGQLLWEKNLGGSSFDRPYTIQQTADGSFVVAGESESSDGDVSGNNGEQDYWVVKLSPPSDVNLGPNTFINSGVDFKVYPNPAAEQLTIVQPNTSNPQTFELQTLTGQRVQTGQLSRNQTLDISNLSSGVYLLVVQSDEAVQTKKVVIR